MGKRYGEEPEEDWDDRGDDRQDPEDPDESDQDDSDEPALVPCPYCRQEISEDAERCPHCGSYVSVEDAPRPRPWFVVGVVVLVAVVIAIWAMKGF